MNIRKSFLVVLGVLGLGGGLGVSQSEAAANGQNQAQNEVIDCKIALKKNTIVALEEFLRKYPLSNSSACGALAFNALQTFTNDPPGIPPGNTGKPPGPGYGG